MEIVICLLILGTVVFLVAALFKSFSHHDLYQKRLASVLDGNNADKTLTKPNQLSFKALLKKFSGLFATRSLRENIQAQLISAGIPLKAEEYISLCVVLILVLPLILYFLSNNLWLAIIAVICGAFLPHVYLQHQKDRRLRIFNQQLGDALVVMANALRAGFGFQQAMDTVRRELPHPIAMEFTWTLREMNLGFSHEEALLNMGKRLISQDLDMIITAIIIQRQVGGNLAEILDNISQTIRERAKIKQQIRTLTAQGKLSGLIIGFLPVVLIAVMLIINPQYFYVMLNDSRGITILAIACVEEVLGIVIIRKIIDINL
ncbi:MAG: type II secretion system F family protein [Syntrophomonadaceae bacterium]|nr:type II secretion system F family protein [Syntrophomonadaceae bacterium]